MVYEYYRSLGISKDASEEEIKKAYRNLALFYNPKRHARRPKTPEDPLESRNEKYQRELKEEMLRTSMYLAVSEAYDVLSDTQRRAIYDNFGEQALKEGVVGPEGFIAPYAYHGDPDLTFKEFFGTDNPFADLVAEACVPMDSFVHQESRGIRPKAKPDRRALPVTLEEAYNGGVRKIIFPRQVQNEEGDIEVHDQVITIQIPRGTDESAEFTFPNQGDEIHGMQPADVVFKVEMQPHPVFKREKDNLVQYVSVTLYEALCGSIIPINTLDGRSFRVYNVHLVHPGYEKIIPGEGMPIYDEPDRKGNLIIRFNVRNPNMLSQTHKKTLKQALFPQTSKGGSRTIYDRRPPVTSNVMKNCVCLEEKEQPEKEAEGPGLEQSRFKSKSQLGMAPKLAPSAVSAKTASTKPKGQSKAQLQVISNREQGRESSKSVHYNNK